MTMDLFLLLLLLVYVLVIQLTDGGDKSRPIRLRNLVARRYHQKAANDTGEDPCDPLMNLASQAEKDLAKFAGNTQKEESICLTLGLDLIGLHNDTVSVLDQCLHRGDYFSAKKKLDRLHGQCKDLPDLPMAPEAKSAEKRNSSNRINHTNWTKLLLALAFTLILINGV